jgi:hypothetical protein
MDPYSQHFLSQTGGNYDFTIGPVYRAGFSRQRGRGLGSIFRNILSFVTPLFKSGATAVGQAALRTGANIVSDLAATDGSTSIKEIAKRRLLETRDDMAKRMRGGGRKRRVTRNPVWLQRAQEGGDKRKVAPTRQRRRAVRRTKLDIFDGV